MFDFGLGSGELLVIAIVALIVIGPKDLPRLLRTLGQYMRKIQGLAREFQNHLNEAAKEAGVDDVKKEVKNMTNFTVTADLDKHGADIKKAIESSAPKPPVAAATNGAKADAEPSTPEAPARPIAPTTPVSASTPEPAKVKAAAKPKPASKPRAKPRQKANGPSEAVKS